MVNIEFFRCHRRVSKMKKTAAAGSGGGGGGGGGGGRVSVRHSDSDSDDGNDSVSSFAPTSSTAPSVLHPPHGPHHGDHPQTVLGGKVRISGGSITIINTLNAGSSANLYSCEVRSPHPVPVTQGPLEATTRRRLD